MNKHVINHRRSLRHACRVPVDAPDRGVFSDLCTIDISQGGIGLVSRKRIPIRRQIAVEVDLNVGGEPSLVLGEVAWVRREGLSGLFRVGVKFLRILYPGSKTRLKNYFEETP